jgi:RNA polymerase sigma-70 factor (ECF subfamily)
MEQSFRLIVTEEKRGQGAAEISSIQQNNDVSLAKRAACGDNQAFGLIYEKYLDQIYRYVFYRVKEKMVAEDLTEEIFLKVWKSIGTFSGKGHSLSTWLYRIAHNHTMDFFRAKRNWLVSTEKVSTCSEIISTIGDPEQIAQNKLMQEEIMELVSTLPDQQKEIIILKFIEGLNNYEIEQITGRSQGSIRITQMRALSALQHKLKEKEERCKEYQKSKPQEYLIPLSNGQGKVSQWSYI